MAVRLSEGAIKVSRPSRSSEGVAASWGGWGASATNTLHTRRSSIVRSSRSGRWAWA